jgi:transposase
LAERKRKRYTADFKKEAVQLIDRQGYTIVEAASSLGINNHMLGRWRREQLRAPQDAFPGTGHRSAETGELDRLREENRKLRIEKEILKKAAVYFAKESG